MNRPNLDPSPIRKAAAQLARLLPAPESVGGEAWRFFHLQTNDFYEVTRTVALACEGSYIPVLLSMDEFFDMVKMSGKSDKDAVYDFSKLTDDPAFGDGNTYFVWQVAADQQYRDGGNLKYWRLMLEFLNCCEKEHADLLAGRLGVQLAGKLSKRVFFVFYGMQCVLPRMLQDSLRTVYYPSLNKADFRMLLDEYWTRNRQRMERVNKGLGCPIERPSGEVNCPDWEDSVQEWYADHMSGISERNVRRLLDGLQYYFQSGDVDFTEFDVIESQVVKYKNEVLKLHDRLEVLETKESDEVQGLNTVRDWLWDHKDTMRFKELAPTGILLVGIPGTGKSATAKMAANIMRLPLVRLDLSKVLGGYVGDSEKGMREMLSDLEYAAPCVLWMDEIEKAMGGMDKKSSGGSSEVITRLFGMLLTFMQENDKPIFIVATANDISKLPPEFFRSGRFDQTFCVMMPDYAGCCDIMRSKLRKRMEEIGWIKRDQPMNINVRAIVDACLGTKEHPRFLTGADIEAHVKELFCGYQRTGAKLRTAKQMAGDMRALAETMRTQASVDSQASMRDIASRYLDMLQRGFIAAGAAGTPFKKCNLDIDRVRYYKYKEADRTFPLRDCITHPKGSVYQEAALASDAAKEWYDVKFFQCVVEQMNELILFNSDLTLDKTREEYWNMRVDQEINR